MHPRTQGVAILLTAATTLVGLMACGGDSDDIRGPAASAKDETPPQVTACPADLPNTITC